MWLGKLNSILRVQNKLYWLWLANLYPESGRPVLWITSESMILFCNWVFLHWVWSSGCIMYLCWVSPALTLILPTVSCGFLSPPPQGMMVCTRFHTFFHRCDPSQWNVSSISSPKSLSRVIRKVYILLVMIFSGLVERIHNNNGIKQHRYMTHVTFL